MLTSGSRIKTSLVGIAVLFAGLTEGADQVAAQDLRVYTVVSDVTDASSPKALNHNLTLFHAGKVYDYLDEFGEVVILEPNRSRFVILSNDFRATEVPFAEVNHFLDSARKELRNTLAALRESSKPESVLAAATVEFQLNPKFEESYDEISRTLKLLGGVMSYSVKTAASDPDKSQFVEEYLDYLDWTAKLNFHLHPNATFPDARLVLNHSLRDRGLLPTQVDLTVQANSAVKLRAEHSFAWELQSIDRLRIHRWEERINQGKVEWVTFRDYQQQLAKRYRR